MLAKKPIGVALVVAVVAMMAAAFSTSASAAVCTKFILCPGASATEKLRDDFDEPPELGRYGADVLAVNNNAMRLELKSGTSVLGESYIVAHYAFFGLKIQSNPVTGCEAGKTQASGKVTFADLQNARELVPNVASPVFAGISPGGFGAWALSIRSAKCAVNPGRVTIENVHLFLPTHGATAVGTITGEYREPEAGSGQCPGGGVKLDVNQPGMSVSGGLTLGIENGAESNTVLCFVSSNNVLYPKVAPEWKELQGAIWQD